MSATNSSDLTANAILVEGKTAVITGASSGIGRATAVYCFSRGMNLWMVDIDKDDLEKSKEVVLKASPTSSPSPKIETRIVDVSDIKQIEQLCEDVFANGGKCHFLMNNAGIGAGGDAINTDMETFHHVMGVNTYGPINGCVTFIPRMKEMNEYAWIVNTGSKQGITMPPGNTTYNVSKAALKCYTEALEHQLAKERRENNGKLKAVLLVPGWVNTSIMLKNERSKAVSSGKEFDVNSVFFHEDKPASGAWMPKQIIEYLAKQLSDPDTVEDKFYIICPDNDVDVQTDNMRMTWTMQDITHDRPPLSRWHPKYKDEFTQYLENEKKK